MIQVAKVINEMIMFDSGDVERINHFMKVYAYASAIGKMQELDDRTQMLVEVAAIVHDIGVKVCEKKYGSCSGELQEKEGPALARQLLVRVGGFDDDFMGRIEYIVAHHHSYALIDNDIDFQILVEADLLVNIEEKHTELPDIRRVERTIFKTEAGLSFLQNLYYEQ